jgi:hypothetical protein
VPTEAVTVDHKTRALAQPRLHVTAEGFFP